MRKSAIYKYLVFLGILLIYPLFSNSSWLAIGTTFIIYSIVALSQDIVLGKAGMFDMGHAMFFGIGAYISAIMNTVFNIPILWAIPVVVLISAIISVLMAMPTIHLRGDYLLVVTIGFNIIFQQVIKNNVFGLTGGPNGIFGIERPSLFGFEFSSDLSVYYLAFFVLILILIMIKNLETSAVGRAFHYLRLDNLAAQCVGINTRFYRLFAFALGASIASIAGVLFAIQYTVISPESFNLMQSILFFTIVIVGGMSSIPGVLLGTFIMFVLPEIFRDFNTYRYLVFGVMMILTMILRPRGIIPKKFGIIPKYLLKDK